MCIYIYIPTNQSGQNGLLLWRSEDSGRRWETQHVLLVNLGVSTRKPLASSVHIYMNLDIRGWWLGHDQLIACTGQCCEKPVPICQFSFEGVKVKAMVRTALKRLHECPSPPKRHTQGCLAWTGSKLHSLTVVSSDAEAIMSGLSGLVIRSLIS